jgi:hypothetical protein
MGHWHVGYITPGNEPDLHVECFADIRQAGWAFHAVQLGARFVLYAQSPDRYVPGAGYTLALSVTPASGGDQPARATAPVPELVQPHRDGQPAEVGHDQVSWFGGEHDQ